MATRNIVPRANNEGGLGTTSKKWANVWTVLVNALTLTAQATGFTIAGGTTSKTLTVDEDVTMSAKANLASPTFTGTPAAPAPTDNTATTQLATTAFAKSQDAVLTRLPDQMIWITAGATETMKVAHSAVFDIATNSFPVGGKFTLPGWKVATTLLQKLTGGAGFQLEVLVTTGYLKLTLNALTFTTTTAPALTNGAGHVIIANVSVGATQTTVYWYIDGVLFETSAAQNNTTSLANGNPLYILGTSTARHVGGVSFVVVGNRSYSSAEVLDLYRNGIAYADRWGSQTSLVTGNDSTFAGASNWANINMNAYDESGDLTVSSTAIHQYCYLPNNNIGLAAEKKYRIAFTASALSGDGFKIKSVDSSSADILIIGSITDGVNSAEWMQTNGVDSTYGLVVQALGTGSITIDNVYVYEIGATLALEPEGIQNDKWYDSSSNALNASYPAAGSSLMRKLNVPRTNTGQPAFLAYNSATDSNATGDSTQVTVVCDTELLDQAANYNNSTGVFTAPVAGKYQFCGQTYFQDIAANHTAISLDLITTAKIYRVFDNLSIVGNRALSLDLPPIVMSAADTAYLSVVSSGGSKVIDIYGDATEVVTFFGGYLVC